MSGQMICPDIFESQALTSVGAPAKGAGRGVQRSASSGLTLQNRGVGRAVARVDADGDLEEFARLVEVLAPEFEGVCIDHYAKCRRQFSGDSDGAHGLADLAEDAAR